MTLSSTPTVARVEKQQLLAHVTEPMLLVVAEAVDRAKNAQVARVEFEMLGGKTEAAIEADRPAKIFVKNFDPLIRQASLQHHLGGVLQMKQHGRLAAVVLGRVERRDSPLQRRDGLSLQLTADAPHPPKARPRVGPIFCTFDPALLRS